MYSTVLLHQPRPVPGLSILRTNRADVPIECRYPRSVWDGLLGGPGWDEAVGKWDYHCCSDGEMARSCDIVSGSLLRKIRCQVCANGLIAFFREARDQVETGSREAQARTHLLLPPPPKGWVIECASDLALFCVFTR